MTIVPSFVPPANTFIDLEKYLLLRRPIADIHDLIGYLALSIGRGLTSIRNKKTLLGAIESFANVRKKFNPTWVTAEKVRVTDAFRKLTVESRRREALERVKSIPMFEKFSEDRSIISLGIPWTKQMYGVSSCILIFEFLCCVEHDCDGFVFEGCVLCGRGLCIRHYLEESSVAKCHRCNLWYRRNPLWDMNEIYVWEHEFSGEIRVSWALPKTKDSVKIDLGCGNSVKREMLEHFLMCAEKTQRQGRIFRRVIVFILYFFLDNHSLDDPFTWFDHVTADRLHSARVFYNLLCGKEYPPMTIFEYNDLVADLMYV